MASRELYKKRVKSGLCVNCGKPANNNGVRCVECAKKQNEYNRKYKRSEKGKLKKKKNDRRNSKEAYRSMKELGLCTCGKALAIGFARCPDCLENDRMRKERIRERDREGYNAKMREYNKRKRQERKEQGLCTVCGKPRGNSPTLECVECRAKRLKRNTKPDLLRSERKSYDLCYHCGKPVMEPYKVCAECYERDMKHLRISWASPLTQKAKKEYSNRFYKLMMADKERKKHESR